MIDAGKLTCELNDLSVDPHPAKSADVQGTVLGASEDGRYVYFVAKGALASGAARGTCPTASEGQCENLYVADTATQRKALVAVLSTDDFPDWRAGETGAHDLSEVTTRVSPNGRYVAFMSERSLTGYDNRDVAGGAPDEEVFLYHAPEDLATEAGTISCASCNPTGERPTGVLDSSTPGPLVDRPSVWEGHWLGGLYSRVDARQPDTRAASAALSVRQRPAVLQQLRRARGARRQRHAGHLRARAGRCREL